MKMFFCMVGQETSGETVNHLVWPSMKKGKGKTKSFGKNKSIS